jgi:hypothetical protein
MARKQSSTTPNVVATGTVCLLEVTAGNIRQSHLYINGHYDFFPADCVGGPKHSPVGQTVDIQLDGLDRTVTTDIALDGKTGKPRGFFRKRGCVRQFFAHDADD